MVSYKALNTTAESSLSNASHGTWNIDGGQRTATHESPPSNASHGTWNIDGGQSTAVTESLPSNASHLTSSNTVSDFSRGSTFILKPFYSSSIG